MGVWDPPNRVARRTWGCGTHVRRLCVMGCQRASIPIEQRWRGVVKRPATGTGKLAVGFFCRPSCAPSPSRFWALSADVTPQERGQGVSGPPESAPPHRAMQIAPIPAGIHARNGLVIVKKSSAASSYADFSDFVFLHAARRGTVRGLLHSDATQAHLHETTRFHRRAI